MDLHDSDETGIQVVCLRFFGVEDLHWESSSWDGEDGSFKEILGEFDSIQCSRGHYQLHVFAFLDRLKEMRESYCICNSIVGIYHSSKIV